MPNQVTLTFAGEERDLSRSFDQVGRDADVMRVRVTDATNATAERFDHLSSQSSLLSGGIGDVGGALTEAFGEDNPIGQFGAEMERVGMIVMGFTGLADLAVFATNNLKLATLAKAGADRVAAAAQWMMNSALLASPITWIVIAIVALIAVIVLIATKTDWFSKAWRVAWGWIKNAAGAAWDWIKAKAMNVWNWLQGVPGRLRSAFSKVAGFLTQPFRTAFNAIARLWNNTIGRLSWTIPGWVPIIGGNSISVPHLPTFHAGGTVPGIRGTAVPIMAMAGERVTNDAGSSRETILLGSDGSRLGDVLVELIAESVARRGGRPQQLGLNPVRLAGR
jgi:hypothetical protein